MYAPQHRPGLKIDLLMEEKLVLVTTQPSSATSDDAGYVHVDWGPEFALHHAMSFSEETPALFIDLGPLALGYILSTGGSGYFRMSVVEPHVSAGKLHFVPGAPQFSYPIYVVYTGTVDDAVLGPALSGLRTIVDEKTASSTPQRDRTIANLKRTAGARTRRSPDRQRH
jgi:hypothetical protein